MIILVLLSVFNLQAAIYGEDNRVETLLGAPREIQNIARSVPALVRKSHIKKDKKSYTLNAKTMQSYFNFCEDSKFSEQKQIANCTGALIGDDLILTAAHCIQDNNDVGCKDYAIVFDYQKSSTQENNEDYIISKDSVYFCNKIVKYEFKWGSKDMQDLAIIKLDRKVKGRKVLKIDTKVPEVGTGLYIIGYPLGIFQKYADDGVVTSHRLQDNAFRHNLDAFSCNSGSPIFDAKTNKIVAVHVRGTGPNHVEVEGRACNDWYQADEEKDYDEANILDKFFKGLKL